MIDTSSVYNLELELAKLPEEQNLMSRQRAEAIKRVDRLQMNLDIFVAERVTEICLEEGITTAAAKTEIRRTRVLLDPFYKKARSLLITATEDMNILNSAYFNLNNKCTILLELYRNARRQMNDVGRVEHESKERLDTRMDKANSNVDY